MDDNQDKLQDDAAANAVAVAAAIIAAERILEVRPAVAIFQQNKGSVMNCRHLLEPRLTVGAIFGSNL